MKTLHLFLLIGALMGAALTVTAGGSAAGGTINTVETISADYESILCGATLILISNATTGSVTPIALILDANAIICPSPQNASCSCDTSKPAGNQATCSCT